MLLLTARYDELRLRVAGESHFGVASSVVYDGSGHATQVGHFTEIT